MMIKMFDSFIFKIKYYFSKNNERKWYIRLPITIFLILFILYLLGRDWGIWVLIGYFGLRLLISLYFWFNNNFIKKIMTLYNTHIFGYRRKGKDLVMQLVIIKRFANKDRKVRKKVKKYLKSTGYTKEYIRENIEEEVKLYYQDKPHYLSNIDYGYGAKVIDLDELTLIDKKSKKVLDYNDILTGTYKDMDIEKRKDFEGLDLYVSDAQLYLPNTEHNKLDKLYPSFPVFFSLAGQLYNMNITVNTQEYERLWVKLRGQQDAYVRALKTIPTNKSILQKIWCYLPILKNYLFIKIRYFEEQKSAENNMLPFHGLNIVGETGKPIYLSSGTAIKEQFEATYGKIKHKLLVIRIKDIKYDSRIFHELLFGYKYE